MSCIALRVGWAQDRRYALEVERTLSELVNTIRRAGVRVSTSEAIDVVRAVECVGLADRAQLYAALLKSAHGARLARLPGYRAEVWDNLHRATHLEVAAKDPQAVAAEVLACLDDPIGLDPVPSPNAARLPRSPPPEPSPA